MNTQPKYPKHPACNTAGLVCALVKALILLAVVMAVTSCTVTVSPDGSKSATVDGPSLLEILRTK